MHHSHVVNNCQSCVHACFPLTLQQYVLLPAICDEWGWLVAESASADMSTKLIGEASCVAGRLSHNEEERYIAVMKELQFGEPLKPIKLYRFCLRQHSVSVNMYYS